MAIELTPEQLASIEAQFAEFKLNVKPAFVPADADPEDMAEINKLLEQQAANDAWAKELLSVPAFAPGVIDPRVNIHQQIDALHDELHHIRETTFSFDDPQFNEKAARISEIRKELVILQNKL